jgi:hypothetical protein
VAEGTGKLNIQNGHISGTTWYGFILVYRYSIDRGA